jgi:hypothetical protein
VRHLLEQVEFVRLCALELFREISVAAASLLASLLEPGQQLGAQLVDRTASLDRAGRPEMLVPLGGSTFGSVCVVTGRSPAERRTGRETRRPS